MQPQRHPVAAADAQAHAREVFAARAGVVDLPRQAVQVASFLRPAGLPFAGLIASAFQVESGRGWTDAAPDKEAGQVDE